MVRPPCIVELDYGQVHMAGKGVSEMEGSPLEVVGQVLYFYWFDSHVLWELELVLEGFVVF